MTDAPSTAIAILTIDHPSRGMFDDRLRRAGHGYDRLRIDDILRRAGYRPLRFESLTDLLAACDTRAFDLFIVQCETACRRTTDAIRALRARFADTVAIVSISQRDAVLAQSACFVAGANEHLPYAAPPDTLIGSIATWLRWSHHRAIHHRHWRIGQFEFDTAARSVTVAGREHVLTEKHFQIATAFFLNMGRALDRAHVSQLVWGSLVASHSRRLDTHVAYLRDRLELDGRHGVRMMTMYGFGYRLVTCEPDAPPGSDLRRADGTHPSQP